MANEVTTQQKKAPISAYVSDERVKSNIIQVVGERDYQRFVSSVVSAVQTNPQLADCTNASIISAALLGHSLKLPQSPQLQMFYMIPFNNTKKNSAGKEEKVKEAVFQLSWRGYLQLAMRSGQYKKINACDIREGELKSFNPITEEYCFEAITDFEKRKELPVIGYYAYFEMVNGFRKELYWTKEQMVAHAKKYSASYRTDLNKGWKSSFWTTDFDAMALKTMIRQIVSKWGMMSVDMETAYQNDMAVQDENGNPIYIDNVPDEPTKGVDPFVDGGVIDVEVKEVEATVVDTPEETVDVKP